MYNIYDVCIYFISSYCMKMTNCSVILMHLIFDKTVKLKFILCFPPHAIAQTKVSTITVLLCS